MSMCAVRACADAAGVAPDVRGLSRSVSGFSKGVVLWELIGENPHWFLSLLRQC